MKTVLLTGATGFVGRQIHKRLLDQGHDVVVVIRPGSGDRLMPGQSVSRIVETPDLFSESEDWWADKLAGVEAVIHAAWYVEWRKYTDSDINFDCVSGTLAMARGAAKSGVRHFVGVGTCMEYLLPSTELTIDSVLSPTTLYSACKLSVYHMLSEYFSKLDLTFSWCRLFYLYGEGENPSRLVPYVRERLSRGEIAKLSAGTQVRDFLDVGKAGAMIADVITTGQPGAINICSGQPTTIRQLVEFIADEYGRRDLLEFGAAVVHPSDPAAVVGVCNAILLSELPEKSNESAAETPHQSG